MDGDGVGEEGCKDWCAEGGGEREGAEEIAAQNGTMVISLKRDTVLRDAYPETVPWSAKALEREYINPHALCRRSAKSDGLWHLRREETVQTLRTPGEVISSTLGDIHRLSSASVLCKSIVSQFDEQSKLSLFSK